ncbi:hypothetical protein [Klebsiella variicola]|uniref:hypothetical protein n=1 Tax=Klebsiella variicola TaxID=244366 RepID=UPI0034D3490E
MNKLIIALLNAVILYFYSPTAQALLFWGGLNIDTKIGLSSETIAMINNLPNNIREQTVLLLQQTLPLIDQRINKLDNIITQQSIMTVCRADAVKQGSLSELIGVNGDIIGGLKNKWKKRSGAFTEKTSPLEYAQNYAEYLYQIKISICKTESENSMNVMLNDLKTPNDVRWLMWYSLKDKCNNAKDCYSKLNDETKVFLSESDERDISTANVDKNIVNNLLPEKKTFKFFDGFNYQRYEERMIYLNNLRTNVTLVRVIREQKEKRYAEQESVISTVKKRTADIESALNSIENKIKSSNNVKELKNILAELNGYDRAFDEMKSSMVSLNQEFPDVVAERNVISTSLNTVINRKNQLNKQTISKIEWVYDSLPPRFPFKKSVY